jgi:hypothetical protein
MDDLALWFAEVVFWKLPLTSKSVVINLVVWPRFLNDVARDVCGRVGADEVARRVQFVSDTVGWSATLFGGYARPAAAGYLVGNNTTSLCVGRQRALCFVADVPPAAALREALENVLFPPGFPAVIAHKRLSGVSVPRSFADWLMAPVRPILIAAGSQSQQLLESFALMDNARVFADLFGDQRESDGLISGWNGKDDVDARARFRRGLLRAPAILVQTASFTDLIDPRVRNVLLEITRALGGTDIMICAGGDGVEARLADNGFFWLTPREFKSSDVALSAAEVAAAQAPVDPLLARARQLAAPLSSPAALEATARTQALWEVAARAASAREALCVT